MYGRTNAGRGGSGVSVIKMADIQVPTSSWMVEQTEEGYLYKAEIEITGVTEEHIPIVTFANEDVDYFYPTAMAGNGIVTIYTDDVPIDTITIKSIVLL